MGVAEERATAGGVGRGVGVAITTGGVDWGIRPGTISLKIGADSFGWTVGAVVTEEREGVGGVGRGAGVAITTGGVD